MEDPLPDDPIAHIEKLRAQIRRLDAEKHSLDGQVKQAQAELGDLYARAGALMGLAPDASVSLEALEAFVLQTKNELDEAVLELQASVDQLNADLVAHANAATEATA